MIWHCPGCGAGFPNIQDYEEHARGCTPLRRGETTGKKKAGKKVEVRPRTGGKNKGEARKRGKGERGRPKGSKNEEAPRLTI